MVFKHDENLVFAKMLDEKLFFTSVVREFEERAVVVSNAPKREKEIINKMSTSEFLYQSPNFGVLRYDKLLQSSGLIPNATDEEF